MAMGRVLVVDDDQNLTFILRAHLANSGYDVTVINNGQEALDYALENRPDVITLDIAMPGLDGLKVTRALRADQRTKHIPIILLTSKGSRDDILVGLDAGAQDYVVKPFDLGELTARIRSMLSLSRAKQEIEVLNQKLSSEVASKTQRLERLYRFVRRLNQATSEGEIFDLVMEAVRESTGCRRVSIMTYDEHLRKLICRRAVGIDPKVAEDVVVDTDSGIAGQVFTTGTTVVARAVDRGSSSENRNYRADDFMSTPLVSTFMMSGERRLGVLNVTDKSDGSPFTTEETECLRSIADSAAIALHNEERRSSLTKSIRALLLTVGRLSEYRDEETGLHLERVAEYAKILSQRLCGKPAYRGVVDDSFVENLFQAAPLHDVGKVGISDEILNKPGKLTDEEFQIMKTHTTIGEHTLASALEETGPNALLQMCVDIAYCHHERYDGKGYPRGIAGDDIPLAARIISIVDAYDAITSARCYKQGLSHDKAVEIIRKDSGSHFDPHLVEAFLEVTDKFDEIRRSKADSISEPVDAVSSHA